MHQEIETKSWEKLRLSFMQNHRPGFCSAQQWTRSLENSQTMMGCVYFCENAPPPNPARFPTPPLNSNIEYPMAVYHICVCITWLKPSAPRVYIASYGKAASSILSSHCWREKRERTNIALQQKQKAQKLGKYNSIVGRLSTRLPLPSKSY